MVFFRLRATAGFTMSTVDDGDGAKGLYLFAVSTNFLFAAVLTSLRILSITDSPPRRDRLRRVLRVLRAILVSLVERFLPTPLGRQTTFAIALDRPSAGVKDGRGTDGDRCRLLG